MTRHTAESVRAACERARIRLAGPLTVTHRTRGDFCAIWHDGDRITICEAPDGELWHFGERIASAGSYHPNEVRAETLTPDHAAAIEEVERLRGQVAVLRATLGPLVEFAEMSEHTPDQMRAFRARLALVATEEK